MYVGGTGNTIGGTTPGAGNVISGNTNDGVEINCAGASGNLVAGNDVGTDVTGTVALANVDDGVEIDNGASSNTIGGTVTGAGNTIAFNTADAVNVVKGTADAILENVIFGNGSGIVLADGGNNNQSAPVITGATSEATGTSSANASISVDLTASGFTAGSIYSLDFFASEVSDPSNGVQAQYLSGNRDIHGGDTGTATFTSLTMPLFANQNVTATATLLAGSTFTDTSTFAAPYAVTTLSNFVVTTTSSTGPGRWNRRFSMRMPIQRIPTPTPSVLRSRREARPTASACHQAG